MASSSAVAGSTPQSATFAARSTFRSGLRRDRAEVHALIAETALGRGDPSGALRSVHEGLAVLEPTDDVSRRARLYAAGLQAAADLAEVSKARRDRDGAADAGRARSRYLARLEAARDGRLVEGGGVNDLVRAMCAWGMAEASRCVGDPDPDAWAAAASLLPAVGETHLAAYCRFREAEAALAGPGDRREPWRRCRLRGPGR